VRRSGLSCRHGAAEKPRPARGGESLTRQARQVLGKGTSVTNGKGAAPFHMRPSAGSDRGSPALTQSLPTNQPCGVSHSVLHSGCCRPGRSASLAFGAHARLLVGRFLAKRRLGLLMVALVALVACSGSDPAASALAQAVARLLAEGVSGNATFKVTEYGLSANGEVSACGRLVDGLGRRRAFVATLLPGRDRLLVESPALPAGLIERATDRACGADAARRYRGAERRDVRALADRIAS